MSKQEDILAGDFGLTDEVAPVAKSADAETLVTRLEDRFSDSMTLLKRIPVTLTLEVSSVEIMLADLLNIDDDTVIELDKLAGEPLDIKVNNILLGKAEVVVVNEKYACACWSLTPAISTTWHHETPHATDAGPWATGARAAGAGPGGDITLLNVVTHGNTQEYSVKIQVLILMPLVGLLPTMVLMMTCFTRLLSCCRCCVRRWGCNKRRQTAF
ncbi:Flagellar motor switch protein FliN [Escherichia coli]|uniref:Flagellar motor switch protein FliN n=3 Tax=Escherichia coli TaxID=562 RepID=A0A377DHT8_ECOLX|nr:Flagellar motor switch protein FliN [Escherichia coli]